MIDREESPPSEKVERGTGSGERGKEEHGINIRISTYTNLKLMQITLVTNLRSSVRLKICCLSVPNLLEISQPATIPQPTSSPWPREPARAPKPPYSRPTQTRCQKTYCSARNTSRIIISPRHARQAIGRPPRAQFGVAPGHVERMGSRGTASACWDLGEASRSLAERNRAMTIFEGMTLLRPSLYVKFSSFSPPYPTRLNKREDGIIRISAAMLVQCWSTPMKTYI